jgi:hypothetical protein
MQLSYIQGPALTPPRVAWQEGERFAVDGAGDVYLVADGVYELVASCEGRRFYGHAQLIDGVEVRPEGRPALRGLRFQAPGRDIVVEVGGQTMLAGAWAGLLVQRGRLLVNGPELTLAEQSGQWWRGGDVEDWYVHFSALPEFRPLLAHPRQRLSPLAAQAPAARSGPSSSPA